MAERPLIFAMANPDPEIKYELARATRPDAIIATGRSDYPNQINNVLGFPFIFRGALDVRARTINEEMKVAAAHALAALAREDVPDSVLRAYGLDSLQLRPGVHRAQAAGSTGHPVGVTGGGGRRPWRPVWRASRSTWTRTASSWPSGWARVNRSGTTSRTVPRRSEGRVRIVFAEGEEPKILRAAVRLVHEQIARPILSGSARGDPPGAGTAGAGVLR